MTLLQSVSRILLLPGHLSAQLLGITAVQATSLLQLSLGGSGNAGLLLLQGCSSLILGSNCSFTAHATCNSAGSNGDDPAAAATAQEKAATNASSTTSAASPADGAASLQLPSSFCSSSGWRAIMLPPVTVVSNAWPAAVLQARGVHSSRGPPPTNVDSREPKQAAAGHPPKKTADSSSGGRGKGRGWGRLGAAAAGVQPGTPRQQQWRPQPSTKGGWVSARQLNSMLKDSKTPQQLLQLMQQHKPQQQGGVLDPIHVATAYHRLGDMCRADNAVAGTAAAQQLLQRLDQLLLSVRGQMDTRGLANIIWSCGHTQHVGPVAQLLADFLLPVNLSATNSQEIANVLWALATLEYPVLPQQPQQLQQLVAASVSKHSSANTQELANFLWAVSELRPELGQQVQAEQLEQLLTAFELQLHKAVPQEISNTLLACARFRYVRVQLLAALEQQQHMQRFLAAANPQNLSNTAWACGVLGRNSKVLRAGLLQQAVKLLQQGSSRFICQDLCNLGWAVAVLDLRQYVPEVLLLAEAASRVWRSAAPEDLRQLYQVHLWLLDHKLAPAKGAKGAGLLRVLSQQQLDECRKAWQDQVADCAAATPTLLQQQVFAALQQLPGWRVPPQQEVVVTDDNFSIDIVAVAAAGVRLAVEVDGPHHFVRAGNRWEVDGPTQYRNRALTERGYTVVSIPWWECGQLKGVQQQQQYLQNKIQGATAVLNVSAHHGTCPACAY